MFAQIVGIFIFISICFVPFALNTVCSVYYVRIATLDVILLIFYSVCPAAVLFILTRKYACTSGKNLSGVQPVLTYRMMFFYSTLYYTHTHIRIYFF